MTYAGKWTCSECGDTSDNEHDPCSCDDTCADHIETIDSLRRRLKQLEAERDTARAEAEQLRSERDDWDSALQATCKAHLAARAEAEQLRAERDALASKVAFHTDGAFAIIRDRTADAIAAHLERFSDFENDDAGDAAAHAVAFCCDQIRRGDWRTTKGDAGK